MRVVSLSNLFESLANIDILVGSIGKQLHPLI